MKLDSIRRDYKKAALTKKEAASDPIHFFSQWMNEALELDLPDATSMALTTVGEDGFPQSRIVLLKDFGNDGFTFFTNYQSEKGRAIAQNPKVSLHFYWAELERQVRITGTAEKTVEETSEQYFHSRPLDSQIAAAVSAQSTEVPSRDYLEEKFAEMKSHLNGADPKRPEHWGGYLVHPLKFEFWQGRANRLHDRIVYEKQAENWSIKRLAP
ncbi:pyridoxamine 5'-phosphate oxidase [Maribellus sp. CM-23]|uniref:pyridoxamine 5'-phosphate oxidase n=1 Tax=Maribellus sp. CM-23 TaxID=2781026 RepID=UPI001F42B9CC|nr:pyridoxamine 5'-phosphate oxidase [Maribellus sp. CM-23]MCE4564880.1 pyridoxamine 5'-phosphate oxidase [Maribellus sp. CM-23]